MAREDTPLDQEVLEATLAAELAKGTDRRVAEGRARSAAVRAYRAAHPEAEAPRQQLQHLPLPLPRRLAGRRLPRPPYPQRRQRLPRPVFPRSFPP
jgi:hypothetical protein